MPPQLQHGDLRPLDGLYLHVLGMVHEGPGDGFNQLLHQAPPRERFPARTWKMRSPLRSRGGTRKTCQAGGELSDLLLTEKAAHGIAGLCAQSYPILDAVCVELDLPRFLQLIVRP